MVTNEERRKVARNLRDSWKKTWHGEKMMHRLRETLGIDQHVSTFGKFRYYRAVAERLADLIYPNTTADTTNRLEDSPISRKPSPINRDALLALADEMELDGAGLMDDDEWCKPLLIEYAHRIREALE